MALTDQAIIFGRTSAKDTCQMKENTDIPKLG